MPGPVPKRSEDRVRQHAPEVPIEKIETSGTVEIPELNLPFGASQMVVDFYDSLKRSAYSKYYEPSDWEYARLTCFIMETIVKTPKPSAEMYKALQTAMSNMLVTEGDRRRLRIEIVREQEKTQKDDMGEVVDMFMKRMQDAEKARAN